MKTIAIIPARGGSKRIPKKNIKLFYDKPIIYYSIKAALDSKLFDEVMVSTDDLEIAILAKKFGAKVPFFRSKKSSDDFATTFDVVKEVIEKYENNNQKFDTICCIYPCAPFITLNKLKDSFKIFNENKFESVFPVIEYNAPIQRALKREGDQIKFINKEFTLSRSQDLEKNYHDAGQFYWINSKMCALNKNIITDNSGCIVISELEAQDIDNEVDWKIAELKYEILQSIK